MRLLIAATMIASMVCPTWAGSSEKRAERKARKKAEKRQPLSPSSPLEGDPRFPWIKPPYDWREDMRRRGGIPDDGWSIYG